MIAPPRPVFVPGAHVPSSGGGDHREEVPSRDAREADCCDRCTCQCDRARIRAQRKQQRQHPPRPRPQRQRNVVVRTPSRASRRPARRSCSARSTSSSRARLHRHLEHGAGLLRLRQRERRHQRSPDQADSSDRATNPSQVAAEAKELIKPTRSSGSSATRTSSSARSTARPTPSDGYKLIAAGIAPQCYSSPWIRERQHGPALQRRRRRADARSCTARRRSWSISPTCRATGTTRRHRRHRQATGVKVVQLTENAASLNGETVAPSR